MKNLSKYFILLVFVFVAVSCKSVKPGPTIVSERQGMLDNVFKMDEVSEITINVSKKEWNRLLRNIDKFRRMETMVKADFHFKNSYTNETLTNVGFRIRGNSYSRIRPENYQNKTHNKKNPGWNQAHFKLGFNKFVKGTRFMGLRGLNLKFFNNQPMLAREIYCYDLFRRFGVWTAFRMSYTKVYIHVEGDEKPAYFGVYGMLEPGDRSYVRTRFGNQVSGYLWKCLYGADFKLGGAKGKIGIEKVTLNKKTTKYKPYDLKTNKKDLEKGKVQLLDFLRQLKKKKGKDFENWIEEKMDVELFLKAQAVNVLLGMWDDYWINQNNYYVYLDGNGRLYFIPYDYDNTLGTTTMIQNAGTQSVFKWGPLNKNRPLITKIMAIPRYKEMYSNYIVELLEPTNKLFDYSASVERIKKWQAMIKPYLTNDTGLAMEFKDENANWSTTPFYKLLSGDKYGGPLDANFFKTRAYYVRMELGLEKELKTAPVEVLLNGLEYDKLKKYYIADGNMKSVELVMESKTPITNLRIGGNVTTNMTNPGLTNRILLSDAKVHGWALPMYNILMMMFDAKGRIKKDRITIVKFENSYKSPEFVGDRVIFRCFATNASEIEIRGWSPKKQRGIRPGTLKMTKVSGDMWEFSTNIDAVLDESIYGFLVQMKTPVKTGKRTQNEYFMSDYANRNCTRMHGGMVSFYEYPAEYKKKIEAKKKKARNKKKK